MAVYAAVLQEEERDPLWSESTEQAILRGVALPHMGGGRLVRGVCGSTLCVSDVVFATAEERDAFLEGMHWTELWVSWGGAFIARQGQDRLRVVVYFTKEGHRLPRVEK